MESFINQVICSKYLRTYAHSLLVATSMTTKRINLTTGHGTHVHQPYHALTHTCAVVFNKTYWNQHKIRRKSKKITNISFRFVDRSLSSFITLHLKNDIRRCINLNIYFGQSIRPSASLIEIYKLASLRSAPQITSNI